MQGIGLALSENYENVNKDISLIACGFPFINDVPDELELEHVQTHRPKGPHGSVGCSELQLTAPHASILNAIYNATKVRIRELPATPDKVLAGLEAIKNGTQAKQKKYYFNSDLHERIDYIKKNPVVPK
jgi:aldehyde oxidoreductase